LKKGGVGVRAHSHLLAHTHAHTFTRTHTRSLSHTHTLSRTFSWRVTVRWLLGLCAHAQTHITFHSLERQYHRLLHHHTSPSPAAGTRPRDATISILEALCGPSYLTAVCSSIISLPIVASTTICHCRPHPSSPSILSQPIIAHGQSFDRNGPAKRQISCCTAHRNWLSGGGYRWR